MCVVAFQIRLNHAAAKAALHLGQEVWNETVPTAEIDRAVRFGLAGLTAGRFRDVDGEEYGVTVRLPGDARKDASALDQLFVGSVTGDPAANTASSLPLRSQLIAKPNSARGRCHKPFKRPITT